MTVLLRALLGHGPLPSRTRVSQAARQGRSRSSAHRSLPLVKPHTHHPFPPSKPTPPTPPPPTHPPFRPPGSATGGPFKCIRSRRHAAVQIINLVCRVVKICKSLRQLDDYSACFSLIYFFLSLFCLFTPYLIFFLLKRLLIMQIKFESFFFTFTFI